MDDRKDSFLSYKHHSLKEIVFKINEAISNHRLDIFELMISNKEVHSYHCDETDYFNVDLITATTESILDIYPPMNIAALCGNITCLKRCYEINNNQWDPMIMLFAFKGGHLDIINYLFESGCGVDLYAVHCALYHENADIVRWIVEKQMHTLIYETLNKYYHRYGNGTFSMLFDTFDFLWQPPYVNDTGRRFINLPMPDNVVIKYFANKYIETCKIKQDIESYLRCGYPVVISEKVSTFDDLRSIFKDMLLLDSKADYRQKNECIYV
jgi:hypothetical protein